MEALSLKPNIHIIKTKTEGSFQNQELHNKCWSEHQFNNIWNPSFDSWGLLWELSNLEGLGFKPCGVQLNFLPTLCQNELDLGVDNRFVKGSLGLASKEKKA